MPDALESYGRVYLERLLLAATVLLHVDPDDRPDTMEVELVLFQERIERALLRESGATADQSASGSAPA